MVIGDKAAGMVGSIADVFPKVKYHPVSWTRSTYPLDFSLDDYALILHGILAKENVSRPVLVGQSLGGYVAQAYADLFPGEVAGLVSIDSAPLKRSYYPKWEIAALRHTKGMYLSIPWRLLRRWGSFGTAATPHGRAQMRVMMERYGRREYCELAAHGYLMLSDAIDACRPYAIDCPALLLCGEYDRAGDVRPFNKKWNEVEGIPLVWVPRAGHNSNVDNPEFVNNQIEQFLHSIDGENV
ncbi:alpha/beta fold hydrolase [uncultured Senegalimassilia sp.]|uniref:alpha/beta fold hydrolase n=1 Tax=uncultured Senegalimassilia sp. TaxID=1714350 RepID=UPI0026E05533|nr:alpha/beta hydrolase [uncultured Senegalimassilia sp.]